MDLDSTEALLQDTIVDSAARTPDLANRITVVDDDEDEVFFGNVTERERNGKFFKHRKRETVCLTDYRRSYDLQSKENNQRFLSDPSHRMSSLFGKENSIVEEDEDPEEDDGIDGGVTVDSVSIELMAGMANVSIRSRSKSDKNWTNNDSIDIDCDDQSPEQILHEKFSEDQRNLSYSYDEEDKENAVTNRGKSSPSIRNSRKSSKPLMGIQQNDIKGFLREESENKEEEAAEIECTDLKDKQVESKNDAVSNENLENAFETDRDGVDSNSIDAETSVVNYCPEDIDDDVNKSVEASVMEEAGEDVPVDLPSDDPPLEMTQADSAGDDDCNQSLDQSCQELPAKPTEDEEFESVKRSSTSSRKSFSKRRSVRDSLADVHANELYFDTTLEQMLLYDILGPEYDELIDEMDENGKKRLRKQLDNMPKDEVQERMDRIGEMIRREEEEEQRQLLAETTDVRTSEEASFVTAKESLTPIGSPNSESLLNVPGREMYNSIGSTVSPFSLNSSTSTPVFTPQSSRTPSEKVVPTISYDAYQIAPTSENHEEQNLTDEHESFQTSTCSDSLSVRNIDVIASPHRFEEPPSPAHTPNYLQPTYASLKRMNFSPQKPVSSPLWLPPSHSPQQHSTHARSPAKLYHAGAAASPSKVPEASPKAIFATPQPVKMKPLRTPNASGKKSRIPIPKPDLTVASPVVEFVKNNPAPPLIQNVKPNQIDNLESTMIDVGASLKEPQTFAALPTAIYTSAKLTQDVEYDNLGKDYHIHKGFGQDQAIVKVTRHVERTRVPAGISWDDEQLVNLDSVCSTPSVARNKVPVKSLLKKTQRNSGLFDESMLDVSYHHTEVIKKLADHKKPGGRGRGRGGAGRGRGSRGARK